MMGGLKDKIPFTYWMMVIGTLALTGFPFTAGYFSKDAIIEAAFVSHNPMAFYAFLCTSVGALLTSFYSWRLILKTFHGRPHDQHHYDAAHESPLTMLFPLGVLGAGSILAGLPFTNIFAGHGVEGFFRESLKFGPANKVLEEMHHIPALIAILPTVSLLVGFAVAWQFYIRRPSLPVELARQHQGLYQFLLNKWYFDELYDAVFVRPAKWLGRFLWKYGDGWLIDGFGPDGVSARVLDVTREAIRIQSGYLYHYAFSMLIGVAALATWFMFSTGSH
jgi:NADH-quinone oxidoreductase subunit L